MIIQQDNFIQRLLDLEKGIQSKSARRRRKPTGRGSAVPNSKIPNVRKKRTFLLNKFTDARLVKYVRRGNSHAFGVLIDRHAAKLKHILSSNLFDKSNVDDVAQDVWEMVVHRVRSHAYKEKGQFYGWLSTLAFRKAVEVNRQKKYNPEFVAYEPDFHDLTDSPGDADEHDEILHEAKKIIATLNERDQQIMRMHYDDGLTLEAISQAMNLTRENVKKRHLRLMKRIRQEIKSHQNLSPGVIS